MTGNSPQPSNRAFRYAVVDLASSVALRPVVPRLLSSVAEPLLARTLPLQLLQVGPWLVDLAGAPEVARTIAGYGAGVPWGYFLHADVDIVSLRQSLRKFNLAKLPDHPREVLFRYWDPRVLRIFLAQAPAVQRSRFMEWVEAVEWPDGTMLDSAAVADAVKQGI